MVKLTREQAAYLCNQLSNRFPGGSSQTLCALLAIEEIIKQCTEQKFPEFEMLDDGNDEIKIILLDNDGDKTDLTIEISQPPWSQFSPVKFKQFTLGCQKIVEWLEQELIYTNQPSESWGRSPNHNLSGDIKDAKT